MEFNQKIADYLNEYTDKNYVFKTFREYLTESPQWDNSDCTFGQEALQKMLGNEDFLDQFSWSGVQDFRTLVNKGDKDSNKFIIQTDDTSKVHLGHCDDGMFKILSLLTHKLPKTYKNIGTVTEIKTVNTHSKFRRKRFASAIYKSMLFEGKLMSDSYQYKGAVKLWKSFIKDDWQGMIQDKKIQVQLYNKSTSTVVFEDITGKSDEEIWSSGNSKSEYRLIAKYKD